MTPEILRALAELLEICENQDKCSEYPLKDFCQKMPCEW